jgi:putative nucleotidyltransferase with HDIG domain
MTLKNLNRPARLYVAAVIAAGTFAVSQAAYGLVVEPPRPEWLILAALTLISGSANVKLPVAATISVSETFVFASVLLFGAHAGTLTVALDAFVVSAWLARKGRTALYRFLFNIAAPAISIWIAANLFFALAGVRPLTETDAVGIKEIAIPLLVFALSYFLLNSWLIAFAIALKEQIAAFAIWRDNLVWLSLNYFGGASVAALLVGYRGSFDVRLLLVLAPIIGVLYFTFRSAMGRVQDANIHLARVNQLYLSTIETLAMAIDAKDQVTHGHIRRVQTFAVALARELGINSEDQLRAIEAAGLLHDMGKLAVPEYILNKPGPLTPAEFSKMKRHAAAGAEILSAIDFPYPVVPIVRHHHENWDGSGYPDGLKGTEIPIGARILSVVDCFDALTSDRPYRPRLFDSEALRILRDRRGSMYDPLVVDAFTSSYDKLSALVDGLQARQESGPMKAIAQSVGRSSTPPPEESPAVRIDAAAWTSRADEAFRILCRLVPDATVVMFIYDEMSDTLSPQRSEGALSSALIGESVPVSERVIGWVAANRSCIYNADARLELATKHANSHSRLSAIPLLQGQATAGVLAAYTSRTLSDAEIGVMESLAAKASQVQTT